MNTVKSNSSAAIETMSLIADDRMAYIKPFEVEGRSGYAIHVADGTPVGWFEERDVAVAAARQHDLEPVSVH